MTHSFIWKVILTCNSHPEMDEAVAWLCCKTWWRKIQQSKLFFDIPPHWKLKRPNVALYAAACACVRPTHSFKARHRRDTLSLGKKRRGRGVKKVHRCLNVICMHCYVKLNAVRAKQKQHHQLQAIKLPNNNYRSINKYAAKIKW